MSRIQMALVALNFIPVLGTFESVGGELILVARVAPLRHGYNNGVFVMYDETGAPWVAAWSATLDDELKKLCREFGFKGPAYVPHSNDGGAFMNGRLLSIAATS